MSGARLGIVTNAFPLITETFVYGEIAGLRRLGLPLTVFSVRRPAADGVSEEVRALSAGTRYLWPPRWLELAAAHARWLLRHPWRYFSTALFLLSGRHERLRDRLHTAAHFAAGVQVASEAQRDGVGHLHAHFAAHAATIALTASRLLGIPFSFTAHAYDIWQRRLLLPEKLAACRFAVTCTRKGREELLAAAPNADPEKVHTVYHGVNLDRFSPGPDRPTGEGFMLLSVSQLHRAKGQHLVLEALAALAREGYRFRFRVVGDGPARAALEEQARSLGLAERVEFAGRVYHEHLTEYYRQAHVFVLPCYQRGGYSDNLPNVLLEAMACAVPVVSTRLAGIPELIEDGVSGFLVEQRDVEGLRVALRQLMADRELGLRMGRAGRRRVERFFDQEASVRRLAALHGAQIGMCAPSAGVPAVALGGRPAQQQPGAAYSGMTVKPVGAAGGPGRPAVPYS